ncbi:MAG: hypothetical protein N2203_02540 [Bacteroidia bacterium]|nr:hypothetical protein [Bacteroidia bacterium]
MEGLKRIMVFVTSKDAKLYYKDKGEVKLEIIESPITLRDDKIEGEGKDTYKFSPKHASNNEHKKHNQFHNEELQYLKTIESKIADYDIIYITGPGTWKNKLNNYISENKKFSDKSVFIEPSENHLTENQLLAKARHVLF